MDIEFFIFKYRKTHEMETMTCLQSIEEINGGHTFDLKQVIGAFMFQIEEFIYLDDISNTSAETNDLIESSIRSYWIHCYI